MDFETAFHELIGNEGALSLDPHDRGNWTGGRVNVGVCKGTKFGISAACLHPNTRVLMRDLTWRRNGEVQVGDQLVGFVHNPAKRGMQLEPAEVLAIDEIRLPSILIETDRREIVASIDHMWWACTPKGTARNYGWFLTRDLKKGDEISAYREPWGDNLTPGAQWLAGIIDGEGCLSENSLCIAQNEGVVAEKIRQELRALGLRWSEEMKGRNINFRITGCAFQLIGELRPVRMLAKAEKFWRGRCTHGRYNTTEKVVSVVDVGEQPVMAMRTSTGTFIAEGLLSHNSYPTLDIANLTQDQARAIYQRDYWQACQCDSLPDSIKFDVFDMAVNSGQPNAIRTIQRALGLSADGVVGPATKAAIQEADPNLLERCFNGARLHFLTSIPDEEWISQGRGLVNRIGNNLMRPE